MFDPLNLIFLLIILKKKSKNTMNRDNQSQPVNNNASNEQPENKPIFNPAFNKPIFGVDTAHNPFSKLGWSGMTIYDPYRTETTTNQYCFQICPRGIGKPSYLCYKFNTIMGSIWCQAQTEEGTLKQYELALHPMFIYLIKKTIAFDSLFEIKETEYFHTIKDEIIETNNLTHDKKKIIDTFIQDMIIFFRDDKILQQRRKQYERQEQRKDGNKFILRANLLKQYNQKIIKWRSQAQQSFMKILEYRKQKNKFSFYTTTDTDSGELCSYQWLDIKRMAHKLCDSVDSIEPLKIYHQRRKYKCFQKDYGKYYKAHLIDNNKNQQVNSRQFSPDLLYISKYVQQSEAILHTIEDLVFLKLRYRQKNDIKDLQRIGIDMIKQVCNVLSNFQKIVSTKDVRKVYHYISPQNIIFDQFSLSPKLKYQPILEEVLGVKNKPATIENLISYFPTPNYFNYFRSPNELDEQVKLILNDSFFGNLEIHGADKVKLRELDKKRIEQEKEKLKQIHEHMLVWRLLLTSYFLMNGKPLFQQLDSLMTEEQYQRHFAEKLKETETKFKKKQLSLSYFLGAKAPSEQIQKKEFNFTFEGILQYIGANIQDKLLEETKFLRFKSYHSYRNVLLRQIIKILVCDTILAKMYNVKKYMCLFSILANQMLEQAETLMKCEEMKPESMRSIRMEVSREMKLRNNKSYLEYLNNTFEKVMGYQKRNQQRDLQARYISKDDVGRSHFQWIKEIKNYIQSLMGLVQELKNLQSKLNEQDNYNQINIKEKEEIYKMKKDNLFRTMKSNNEEVKTKCCKLILTQINAEDPKDFKNHKVNKEASLPSLFSFNQKFLTMVISLFLFQINNLPNYESLVIPYLSIDESEKKYDIKEPKTQLELKKINEDIQNITFLQEILASDLNDKKKQELNDREKFINKILQVLLSKSKNQSYQYQVSIAKTSDHQE